MIMQKEVKVEVRVLNLRKSVLRQLPQIHNVPLHDVLNIVPICWVSGNVLGGHKGFRWIVAQMNDTLVLIDTKYVGASVCKYKGLYIIWGDYTVKHAIVR